MDSTKAMQPFRAQVSNGHPMAVTAPPTDKCTNTRYMFGGCSHIRLMRCALHPVDPETRCTTCPNPRAGFTSVYIEGKCPSCFLPADLEEKIESANKRLHELRATRTANFDAKRDIDRNGPNAAYLLQRCTLKSQVIAAGMQSANEDIRRADRQAELFFAATREKMGGRSPELIGYGMMSDGHDDFSWVRFFSSEGKMPDLWTWMI